MLRNFKEMSSNMGTIRKKYNEQAHTLMQFMLPEYERNCLKEYLASEESLIFFGQKEQAVGEAQTKLKEFGARVELEQLYQSFRREKREVEAFLEAIKVKEDYENAKDRARQKVKDLELEKQKIMAGKTSLSSMIKSKSK
jgi:sorting nexin-1/2